jgi:hypothetical protein
MTHPLTQAALKELKKEEGHFSLETLKRWNGKEFLSLSHGMPWRCGA